MKEFIKHNPAALDNVETMANAMIESMRFVDNRWIIPKRRRLGRTTAWNPSGSMTPTTAPFPLRN